MWPTTRGRRRALWRWGSYLRAAGRPVQDRAAADGTTPSTDGPTTAHGERRTPNTASASDFFGTGSGSRPQVKTRLALWSHPRILGRFRLPTIAARAAAAATSASR